MSLLLAFVNYGNMNAADKDPSVRHGFRCISSIHAVRKLLHAVYFIRDSYVRDGG